MILKLMAAHPLPKLRAFVVRQPIGVTSVPLLEAALQSVLRNSPLLHTLDLTGAGAACGTTDFMAKLRGLLRATSTRLATLRMPQPATPGQVFVPAFADTVCLYFPDGLDVDSTGATAQMLRQMLDSLPDRGSAAGNGADDRLPPPFSLHVKATQVEQHPAALVLLPLLVAANSDKVRLQGLHLQLGPATLTPPASTQLCSLVSNKGPALRQLTLRKAVHSAAAVSGELAQALLNCPQLSSLQLVWGEVVQLPAEQSSQLCSSIEGMTGLQELRLQGLALEASLRPSHRRLPDALMGKPQLHTLHLEHLTYSDGMSRNKLSHVLGALPQLTDLSLAWCQIGKQAVWKWEHCALPPALCRLDLSGNLLTASHPLLAALGGTTALTHLYLDCNALLMEEAAGGGRGASEAQVQRLGAALMAMQQLAELSLSLLFLSDPSQMQLFGMLLACSLPHLHKLRVLKLSSDHLDDTVLQGVLLPLLCNARMLPQLESLDLTANHFSPAGLRSLHSVGALSFRQRLHVDV